MSSLVPGAKGDIPVFKQAMTQRLALGESLKGSDFVMTFEGDDQISVLVAAAQMPSGNRELLETTGPMGVKLREQGNEVRSGEMPVQFNEVITGQVSEFLRTLNEGKKDITTIFKAISESNNAPPTSIGREFLGCWFAVDPTDFSNDDSASPIKIAATMHFQWWSYI